MTMLNPNHSPKELSHEMSQADLLETFRLALYENPNAPAPAELDAADAEFLREMMINSQRPRISSAARRRIWSNALAQRRPRRKVQPALVLIAAVFALVVFGTIAISINRTGQPAQLTQIETGVPFADLPVITADNLNSLTELADVGNGVLYNLAWVGEDTIAASGYRGVWLISVNDPDASLTLYPLGEQRPFAPAVFTRDGSRFAAVDEGGVTIYDTLTGAPLGTAESAEAVEATVTALSFGTTGTGDDRLAVAYAPLNAPDNTAWVSVFELSDGTSEIAITGERIFRLTDRLADQQIVGLGLSGDSTKLVTYTNDFRVTLWDALTSESMWSETLRTTALARWDGQISFSIDGEQIAVPDGTQISLFSTGDGQQTEEINLWSPSTPPFVTALRYAPNGQHLAITTINRGFDLYTISTNTSLSRGIEEIEEDSYVQGVAYSPSGGRFATLQRNKRIQIWDTDTRALIGTANYADDITTGLSLSLDQQSVIRSGLNGTIYITNLMTGQQARAETNHYYVNDIAFRSDGIAAFTTMDPGQGENYQRIGALGLIDPTTGEIISTLTSGDENSVFSALTVDADGSLYAVNSRSLQRWEIGETVGTVLYTHDTSLPFTRLAISGDDRFIAFPLNFQDTLIHDTVTGQTRTLTWEPEPDVEADGHTWVAFSSDGRQMAAINGAGYVVIWDTYRAQITQVLETDGQLIAEGVFTESGDSFVTVRIERENFNGDAFISWNLESGERNTREFPPEVTGDYIEISRDGRFIVISGDDGLVRVWGVAE